MTMNGATASGYDYLKPILRPEPPPEDPHSNPYVETPTSLSSKYRPLSAYEEDEGEGEEGGANATDVEVVIDQVQPSVTINLHQPDTVEDA